MSTSTTDAGARAPRIPCPWHGWRRTARLGVAVLACTFAGAGQAQDREYDNLSLAVNLMTELLVAKGDLSEKEVFVSPRDFFEMGSERSLPLSRFLARKLNTALRRHGVTPVTVTDDENVGFILRGEWDVGSEAEWLYLFLEVKQLTDGRRLTTLVSEEGRVRVGNIDRRHLDPDLESHGRFVVRQLESDLPGSGRYRLHIRPFEVQDATQPERLSRRLHNRWRRAFTGSRRFRLVGSTGFHGELFGHVVVTDERVEVDLFIQDTQGQQVAAAHVAPDKGLFPSDLFGPDVTAKLAKCAGLVEAGRLEDAKACYEDVRVGASGDAGAVEGVRAGLERIARMEAVERGVRDAIGRGEFGEAREGLERLRELNASHPRLVELEGEIVRAEREWEERKRADDAAFERAKGAGTVTALDGYLSSCAPLCGHAEEARRLKAAAPGRRFRDCAECPELVVVPSGSYRMGSPSGESGRFDTEGPVHRVRIGRPFAVGVYEVTFGEWDACVSGRGCGGYRPGDRGWGRGRRPVVNVSWDDAKAYVDWLSGKTGEEYRLLSESEWEYVTRAGTRTAYWWGDEIGRNRANCLGCGSRWDGRQTAPVGSFSANGFGLYDVHGNVWEWVEDCYEGDCSRRVLRGGSWNYFPGNLRSANRNGVTSGYRVSDLGFRVARTLTP